MGRDVGTSWRPEFSGSLGMYTREVQEIRRMLEDNGDERGLRNLASALQAQANTARDAADRIRERRVGWDV